MNKFDPHVSDVILLLFHLILMISKVNHAQNHVQNTGLGKSLRQELKNIARPPAPPLNLHHILPATLLVDGGHKQ